MRRGILALGCLCLLLTACPAKKGLEYNNTAQQEAEIDAPASEADSTVYDIVLQGGRVLDPETRFDSIANIGITGDRIVRITEETLQGQRVIDVDGLTVVPGFIDTCVAVREHSAKDHADVLYWKISDGVTTALWLHDGTGFINRYKDMLAGTDLPVNYGFGARIADYSRDMSTSEIAQALRESLEDGALSVSISPEYQNYMDYDECLAYARVAAEYNVPLMIHTRFSHENNELQGVEEAVSWARETGAQTYIFHLNSTGGTYHMDRALEILNDARESGLSITASVYPYSYWMTFIGSSRFNPGWQEAYGLTPEDIFYIPEGKYLNSGNWAEYRSKGGLVTVPEGTIDWQSSTLPALAEDWMLISSDGSYNVGPDEPREFGHPRDTGTFAHSFAVGRTYGIPLMTIVEKITLLPAKLMESSLPGYRYRGRLQEGCYADITVLDPVIADGMGTIENPGIESAGIEIVIVNGIVAWENGTLTANAGRFMERGAE